MRISSVFCYAGQYLAGSVRWTSGFSSDSTWLIRAVLGFFPPTTIKLYLIMSPGLSGGIMLSWQRTGLKTMPSANIRPTGTWLAGTFVN